MYWLEYVTKVHLSHFSPLAEATMHLVGYYITKKPQVTYSTWLEVGKSLVTDLWLSLNT